MDERRNSQEKMEQNNVKSRRTNIKSYIKLSKTKAIILIRALSDSSIRGLLQ